MVATNSALSADRAIRRSSPWSDTLIRRVIATCGDRFSLPTSCPRSSPSENVSGGIRGSWPSLWNSTRISHTTAITSFSLKKLTWTSRYSVSLLGSIASQESMSHRTSPHLRTQRSPNSPSTTPRSVPTIENTPTAIVSQLNPRRPFATRAALLFSETPPCWRGTLLLPLPGSRRPPQELLVAPGRLLVLGSWQRGRRWLGLVAR